MKNSKRGGVSRRIVFVPEWAHCRIIQEFTRLGVDYNKFLIELMREAVSGGALTLDYGERYEVKNVRSSALKPKGNTCNFHIPARLDAEFSALARAHGFTYGQAATFLISWVCGHTDIGGISLPDEADEGEEWKKGGAA